MTRLSQFIVTIIALLAFVLPAAGQDSSASSSPSLSLQFRALETMNSTVSDSLGKSKQREEQMSNYIDAKGLTDKWQAYTAKPEDMPHTMDFNKALKIAIDHERILGPAPVNQDPNLAREVQAYTNLVKGSWEQYQASMVTVARMSEFLQANGEFDGYHPWAHDQNQKKQAEIDATAKANADKKLAEEKTRKKQVMGYEMAAQKRLREQHQQYLKTQWQHYAFNMEQETTRDGYNARYSGGHSSEGNSVPGTVGGGGGYWNNYADGYGDVG